MHAMNAVAQLDWPAVEGGTPATTRPFNSMRQLGRIQLPLQLLGEGDATTAEASGACATMWSWTSFRVKVIMQQNARTTATTASFIWRSVHGSPSPCMCSFP
jgi:hypothetical protein